MSRSLTWLISTEWEAFLATAAAVEILRLYFKERFIKRLKTYQIYKELATYPSPAGQDAYLFLVYVDNLAHSRDR